MLTRCPDCRTTFRVTPMQIKSHAGKVRCGQCNFVFNAIDTLSDELKIEPQYPPVSDHASAAPLQPVQVEEADAVVMADAGEQNVAERTPSEETAPETEAAAANAEPIVAELDLPEPPSVTVPPFADPLLHETGTPTRRWPWIVGSIFALLVLLAQGVYHYRVEIAVLRPDLRPLLLAACKQLNCTVPRPRHIDTLSIEASDLRPDPIRPGRLALIATLRSRAPFAQEWPDLELTLTDVADRKLAVKNLQAADYLPKDTDLKAGFPANGEIAVDLPLDVGDLPAVGYRLYIFYR
jgi:predicted Zn finger-like uncharacterized protein